MPLPCCSCARMQRLSWHSRCKPWLRPRSCALGWLPARRSLLLLRRGGRGLLRLSLLLVLLRRSAQSCQLALVHMSLLGQVEEAQLQPVRPPLRAASAHPPECGRL